MRTMRGTVAVSALLLAAIAYLGPFTIRQAQAASPTLFQAASGSGDMQIKPQAVPTSTTVVAATDAYLRQVVVTNPTGGAITFTLSDRQSSAIDFVSAVSIAANTTYVVVIPNLYWCPNGFTVAAGGSGLTYYALWRQ